MTTPHNLLPESPAPGPYTYAASADTLLTISGFGTMLYQARGLSQSLEIIKDTQQQVRDVNGVLRDISNPIFRKYSTKITCSDINAPPLDGIWPGMAVTVGCTAWLCYPTGRSGSPARNQVSGSSYVLGNFTFYQPILDCLVMAFNETWDEWGAKMGWTLVLEEV